jgi:hypothetical protein
MQGAPNGGVFVPANLGLYTYAWNKPVTITDPNGQCPGCMYSGTDVVWQERFVRDPEGAKRQIKQQARGFVGAIKSIIGRVMSTQGDSTSNSEVSNAAVVSAGNSMSNSGDKMVTSSGDADDSSEDKFNRAQGAVIGAIVAVVGSVFFGKAKDSAAKEGPKVHAGQQGKHVPGHNNFKPGRSELTHPDPQALLDKGVGTGVRHGTKEVVDFGEEIGTHVAKDGTRTPTTRGTIHYNSKNEAHIVPARPERPK